MPSQHIKVGLQFITIVDHHSNSVDPTLKMKQNPKSDFQCCTTLIQCQCLSVKTTLSQSHTTSIQSFFKVAQCSFNVVSTLIWHYLDVVSTSVKAISKPIWLVKRMDLQKD